MNLRDIRIPLVIVLLSILFGTGLGALFGAGEERVKAYLASETKKNTALMELPEAQKQAKQDNLKKTAWKYLKRGHFHGGGIAALSLGLLLLLAALSAPWILKSILGYSLAMGSFVYPFFWLLSGLYTPSLGATMAKAKFEWIAYGGVLHVLATLGLLFLLIRVLWKNEVRV